METLTHKESTVKHYQNGYTAAIAALTVKGLQSAVERGQIVNAVPLGYKLKWGDRGREVIIDEERAPLMIKAFELAGGGMSLRAVLQDVLAAGLTGRNGKPLCLSTLHHALRNPFYCGQMRHAGKLYTGNYPALISRTLFEKVQAKLRMRRYR